MSEILAIISPIYIVILLGYITTRAGLFDKPEMRVFGRFVLNLALPALIFNAVAQRPIADILNGSYIVAYLGGSLLSLSIGFFCARRFARMNHTGSTFAAMGVSCSNSGYIGLPILMLTMAPVASVALALNVVVENIVIIPLLLMMAEGGRNGAGPAHIVLFRTAAKVARAPMVIALALGLAASLFAWIPPGPVAHTVNLFAQASGALSLFVIGGTLVGLPLRGIGPRVVPIAVGKLAGHPLAVLLVASVLPWIGMPPLDPPLRSGAVLMAAMPMLGIYPILAQGYGLAERSAAALLITTVLSFFTLSGSLWLLGGTV
jgi:predicted permease